MHAKPGLRVVLKWKIYRPDCPDSVIADVIPLKRIAMKAPTRFTIRAIFILTMMIAVALSVYRYWDLANRTWVVDFSDEVVTIEHTIGGPGFYTYGVTLRQGEKSCIMLSTNRRNPFDLEDGDRVVVEESFWTKYRPLHKGYHASPSDFIKLQQRQPEDFK